MGYVKNLLKNIDKPVLFDVGANRGDYAKELVKNYRNAEIHCFEPAAETFKILCSQVKSDKVIMNNFGMSDTCTESILYYDAEPIFISVQIPFGVQLKFLFLQECAARLLKRRLNQNGWTICFMNTVLLFIVK